MEGPFDCRFLLKGAASVSMLAALPTFGHALPQGIVNVRDFGANGDGSHIDSPATERAIAYAVERGGGTVYVPPGTYASYTVHLKSDIALWLDRGATQLAASVPLTGTIGAGYGEAEPQYCAANACPAFSLQYVEGFNGPFLNMPAAAPAFRAENSSGLPSIAIDDLPDRRFDASDVVTFRLAIVSHNAVQVHYMAHNATKQDRIGGGNKSV